MMSPYRARSGEVVLAGGDAGDAVEARGEADAGTLGDVDGALRGDGYFGGDDVFVPVTLAGGDVAGEREIGERGHGDVLGAADAGFEHAAAPDGDGVFPAEIVNAFGFVETADAAELDVDDLAGTERDSGFGLFVGVDALVEADRSLQVFLDFDVAEEVVPAERLFNHHEVKTVELLEERPVLLAVGRVGVHHQFDTGKILPKALDKSEILAGLDFDFDALIAGGEFGLDRGGEFVERIFYADGDAAGDFLALAADEFPERNIFELGFRVPDGGFEGGFGHVVAANVFEERPDIGSGGEFPALEHGPEKIFEDVPGGFGVFGRIEGRLAGGAFPPAGGTVDMGFGEDDAALGDTIHAGFERGDELEMDFTKGERAEAHECP